jgi:integrase
MKKNKFHKVFDSRNRRVRGLWIRNGNYYAQLVTVDGSNRATKVKLQGAQTVPQAIAAMQEKKSARSKGELVIKKVRGVLTLKEAGEGYLASIKALGNKSESTQELHGFCADRWNEFGGSTPINKINASFVHRYGEWRKPQQVAGRTIDIEVSVLRKVLEWAVTHEHLREVPNFRWKSLAEPSEEKRLLTEEEIDSVCNAAIAAGNIQVADHLRLLAYTGMREQEGCRARWCDVDWTNKQIKVPRVVDNSRASAMLHRTYPTCSPPSNASTISRNNSVPMPTCKK